MPPRRAKLAIVDQSLKGYDGHHLEYDLAVARAARTMDLDAVILAHSRFAMADVFPVPVLPWFAQSAYDANRSGATRAAFAAISLFPSNVRRALVAAGVRAKRLLRNGPSGAAGPPPLPAFGQRLVEALTAAEISAEDHVFIHTFFNAELHALAGALLTAEALPHFHFVLRRDAEEPNIASDPWGGIAAALEKLTGNERLAGRLHLYGDTEQLAAQYNALLGEERVGVLPIPHCLEDMPEAPPEDGAPLRLTYLGNARSEKGFDLLPGLATALARDHLPGGKVQLVAQSNIPVSLEEAETAKAVAELARYPDRQVTLIDRELSVEEFQRLLFEADIVLLPYRADIYRRRSSGILIQALAAGKPVVVPEDSWLSDEAPAGTAVTFGKNRSFADAARHAIDHHVELATAAAAARKHVLDEHNADRLVHSLISAAAPDHPRAGKQSPRRSAS